MKALRAHGKSGSRVHQLGFEVADDFQSGLPRDPRSIAGNGRNYWRRRLTARRFIACRRFVCRRRGGTLRLNRLYRLGGCEQGGEHQRQNQKGGSPKTQHVKPQRTKAIISDEAGECRVAANRQFLIKRSRVRASCTAGTWS